MLKKKKRIPIPPSPLVIFDEPGTRIPAFRLPSSRC
jgi:hypothetical protein